MSKPYREFLGYRRENGAVGVRNLLLALPAVVCANRAAFAAAQDVPGSVALEHPLGCAQIGVDKEQTFRTLVGIGSHPNVNHTAVIGLGCEGIAASSIFQGIIARGHSADVLTIQEAGGTTLTAFKAAEHLRANTLPHSILRETMPIDQLIVGIGKFEALGDRGRAIIDEILDRGGRILKAVTATQEETLLYAEPCPISMRHATMQALTGDSETITGLAAAGAQIILAQGDAQYLGGHPVCPVIRIGYNPELWPALSDDIDGMIDRRTPSQWVDYLLEVASGNQTASELLGSQVFAIERVGPTL